MVHAAIFPSRNTYAVPQLDDICLLRSQAHLDDLLTEPSEREGNVERKDTQSTATLTRAALNNGLNNKEAERVLEAITSNDTPDIELSDDEVDDPSFVVDVSSEEEEEEQNWSSTRSRDATWRRGVSFDSAISDVRCAPDTSPDVRQHWRPSDYFRQYLSDAAFDIMQEKTVVAFHQKMGKILNSSCSEMQNFQGATLMMSCLGYPQMRLYWARGTRVPAIADVLTRDRFFTLRSNFKVVNDFDFTEQDQKNDRLWKYKEDSALLGMPKKNILGLLEFKMSLAHYLLSKNRCGEESGYYEPPRKVLKAKVVPLPPKPKRTTKADHMPELKFGGDIRPRFAEEAVKVVSETFLQGGAVNVEDEEHSCYAFAGAYYCVLRGWPPAAVNDEEAAALENLAGDTELHENVETWSRHRLAKCRKHRDHCSPVIEVSSDGSPITLPEA
ncbi:hypothetical protein HPB51_020558 [Rhipicephalus microplus]|uniref:PiggyBac transposable element-derived protein domain-containing protein n=1 Tax=Rhipicephalus microplus TaxID=6941 RepID=A0A9J6DXG8_RHIMP|nr:hypothetical protein HPB51_020558 [Rhipicephalus microplus]